MLGLPPQTRGKDLEKLAYERRCGITPAYAGKSLKSASMQGLGRDHPRVCGEKACSGTAREAAVGSPPRMRGKVTAFRAVSVRHGITPAYAGKSAEDGRCRAQIQGSPPRMRGKAAQDTKKLAKSGITPAYAGKRYGSSIRCYCARDHPRVCGEKRSAAASCSR